MDASLLFRIAACKEAYFFYQLGERANELQRQAPMVPQQIRNQVFAWFSAGDLHPLSFTRITNKQFSVQLDRLTTSVDGLVLSKLIYASASSQAIIKELALSVWLLKKRGYYIAKVEVYVINKEYIREGELDYKKLFNIEDYTKTVIGKSYRIDEIVPLLVKNGSISMNTTLCRWLDTNCQYAHKCFAHIPPYSVLNIAHLAKESKHDLLSSGIVETQDVPREFLSDYQLIQIECDRTKRRHIDKLALAQFLQKIVYPIYFLDFEAINYAVPMFDRTRALSPLVFQYSLHILNSQKSRLKHDEFLAPSDADPRRAIAERLCGAIGENGTVVAFGATFERTVIRELAELFPDLRAKLQSIVAKTVDLMIPFEKRWFYHPKMHGSCSLKSVAPAIDSKAAYDGAIKNGIGAMERYLGLLGETDETAIASRKELLSYCEKDTLYMVSIFRALTRAAR